MNGANITTGDEDRVKHTRAPPYHPSTNGAAERFVQVLKKSLKWNSQLTIKNLLSNLIFSYRSTPHTTIGASPAKLFLKWQLRVYLSVVKPDQEGAVLCKQEKQKDHHDHGMKILHSFMPGETVTMRQFWDPDKWQ